MKTKMEFGFCGMTKWTLLMPMWVILGTLVIRRSEAAPGGKLYTRLDVGDNLCYIPGIYYRLIPMVDMIKRCIFDET